MYAIKYDYPLYIHPVLGEYTEDGVKNCVLWYRKRDCSFLVKPDDDEEEPDPEYEPIGTFSGLIYRYLFEDVLMCHVLSPHKIPKILEKRTESPATFWEEETWLNILDYDDYRIPKWLEASPYERKQIEAELRSSAAIDSIVIVGKFSDFVSGMPKKKLIGILKNLEKDHWILKVDGRHCLIHERDSILYLDPKDISECEPCYPGGWHGSVVDKFLDDSGIKVRVGEEWR